MALIGLDAILRAGKRPVYALFGDENLPQKPLFSAEFPFVRHEGLGVFDIRELVEKDYVYIFHCIKGL